MCIRDSIYTTNGTLFRELRAVVEMGQATTGTSAKALRDSDIVDFIKSDVRANDVVYYTTRDAYGLISSRTTVECVHTNVCAASTGVGITNSGEAVAGDRYEIIDTIAMNVISTANEYDNVALATSGTNASVIRVDGTNFANTEIRIGDFVSNTTRSALTRVTRVSADINVNNVTGMVSGDSLVFLKSAMPLTAFGHVHYSRLYLVDVRDRNKIRVSGVDDATNFTTDAGTIESHTFSIGGLQPRGDEIIALGSFQKLFVMIGRKYIYIYEGTVPISTSAAATGNNAADFVPVALFPTGSPTSRGLTTIGDDFLIVTDDGIHGLSQSNDPSIISGSNVSEAISTTIRPLIENTPPSQIILLHYPRRSWVLFKLGSEVYVYNYNAIRDIESEYKYGSWSVFDGLFGQLNDMYIRHNGDLIGCSQDGNVYEFDKGTYDDDGQPIFTEYQTGWLTLEEPENTTRIKETLYIKPHFETGSDIKVGVRIQGFGAIDSSDSAAISSTGMSSPIGLNIVGTNVIGGSKTHTDKFPLMARGESLRVLFTTDTTSGPDVISKFTLYGNIHGRA